MENLTPKDFRELFSFISFLFGLIFSFISLSQQTREHALRISAILLMTSICLFANSSYCYFAGVFIIATAVTQLDFLQNLAAIIRGSKEYFEWKKETIPAKELERTKEEEISAVENALPENVKINEKNDKNSIIIEKINRTMSQQNLSGVQFALLTEQYAFNYLEKKFDKPIQRYQRVISSGRQITEFDGIVAENNRDIVIEIKVTRRTVYPTKYLNEQILSLIDRTKEYKKLSKREVSLRMVIIGQLNVDSKNRIIALLPKLNDYSENIEVIINFLTFEDIGLEFESNTTPNSN